MNSCVSDEALRSASWKGVKAGESVVLRLTFAPRRSRRRAISRFSLTVSEDQMQLRPAVCVLCVDIHVGIKQVFSCLYSRCIEKKTRQVVFCEC